MQPELTLEIVLHPSHSLPNPTRLSIVISPEIAKQFPTDNNGNLISFNESARVWVTGSLQFESEEEYELWRKEMADKKNKP